MCHTGILHRVAQLDSIFNVVIRRSFKLLSPAIKSHSMLVLKVFSHASNLVYSSTGCNEVYGFRHQKIYSEQDDLYANFIRDVKLAPELNRHLLEDVLFICTS